MAWLHPVLGICTVLLILWVGMAGLGSRQRDPSAPAKRRQHARLAPVAGVLSLLAAVAGTASAALIRDDLVVATSWHFRVGWLCAALAVAAWLSSRRIHQAPQRKRQWKKLHPWIGLCLMAAAASVAALGVGMLP